MWVTVKIEFECEIQDERDLRENIKKNLKPMLDFYHTAGVVNLSCPEYPNKFVVEGSWNG